MALPSLSVLMPTNNYDVHLIISPLFFNLLILFPLLNAEVQIPKYVDNVTPQYKPKFDALVRKS